jgi:hypothetical protein
MKPHLKSRHRLLLIPLTLACFALSPGAQAVSPAPDGGYANGNTAEGTDALLNLTTGSNNTALGFDALSSNISGNENTASGGQALTSNTTGDFNTATGFTSLTSNATGTRNTGTGHQSLYSNTTGERNTGTGFSALFSNTTGYQNAAHGWIAMFSNTTGFQNTADGGAALGLNTTGSNNIALGFAAAYDLTAGDNNIDVAHPGVAAESNTIRIGNQVTSTDLLGVVHTAHTATFIAGISGAGVSGRPVFVNGNGQLGIPPSSQRFKEEIAPMGKASEAILALRPVTFRYKHELDPDGIPQFGLVAEQVEKVNPALVARDDHGKVYTVRYEAVNAMLLNEFLKEHRKVEEQNRKIREQEATITRLDKGMKTVVARLEEQASQIQKVSAQLEASRRAQQTVVSNP